MTPCACSRSFRATWGLGSRVILGESRERYSACYESLASQTVVAGSNVA